MDNDNTFRVKITIGDAVIEIEGKDVAGINQVVETVRGILQSRPFLPPHSSVRDAAVKQEYLPTTPSLSARPDVKSFFGEKNPKTLIEAAATIAFFLEHVETDHEKKLNYITTEVLMDELRKAQFPLPKVPSQVLIDAKINGYFDNAGTGRYRLNSVGYNLVSFALGKDRSEKSKKKIVKKKKVSEKK